MSVFYSFFTRVEQCRPTRFPLPGLRTHPKPFDLSVPSCDVSLGCQTYGIHQNRSPEPIVRVEIFDNLQLLGSKMSSGPLLPHPALGPIFSLKPKWNFMASNISKRPKLNLYYLTLRLFLSFIGILLVDESRSQKSEPLISLFLL